MEGGLTLIPSGFEIISILTRLQLAFPSFPHFNMDTENTGLKTSNRLSHLTHLISFDTGPPPFASFKKDCP